MSEHAFNLGQQVVTLKNHTWRVKGSDYAVEAGTPATIVDFGRYSNDPQIQFEDGVKVTSDPKLIQAITPKLSVNRTFDGTQREVVFEIAQKIHGTLAVDRGDLSGTDLFNRENAEPSAILKAAETIFEMFFGNLPTYDDDEETTAVADVEDNSIR